MRPIKITEEMKQTMLQEFAKLLSENKNIQNGKFSYNQEFKSTAAEKKAVINFEPMAYLKMFKIIDACIGEAAWYASVEKTEKTTYHIKDIYIYPQYVSAAHVDQDEQEMAKWEAEMPDEVFNTLLCQMHSHVNFATSPSGTDLADQAKVLANLNSGFYIFMIVNKKKERNAWIYDIDDNTLYENSDINITVGDGLEEFEKSIKEFIKPMEEKPGYPAPIVNPIYSYYSDFPERYYPETTKTEAKTKKETKAKKETKSKKETTTETSLQKYLRAIRETEGNYIDYDAEIFGGR